MTSVIQYARAADLKSELNDQFRQRHEDLDPSITLSKIRNLKLSLLQVGLSQNLELSTVAKAYVFLEKLITARVVTKSNRKVIAATCLFLATKINDNKELRYTRVLATIEKHMAVSSKSVREQEFWVFVQLKFHLHITPVEYMPHLDRLITLLDFNSLQEYLNGKLPPQRDLPFIY
jgi:hypothetical protein